MHTKILTITRRTSNRNAIKMFKDILRLSFIFIPYIALITLTFITVSCTMLDPNMGSMILDIDPGYQINTVLPDIDMIPAQYEFHGEGPNGGSFDIGDDQLPVYQGGLEFGEWMITVNVKNAEGIIIALGVQTATVHTGEVITLRIPIRPVSGHGTLDLNVYWNEADIYLPSLHGQLILDNGTPIELDFTTIDPGHTQCIQESIPTGYHTLIIQLLDSDVHVAGAVEVIRVIDSQTTFAVFEFYDINQSGGDISIILTPQMDEPLDIELTGQEVEILEGDSMTVTATVPIDVGTVEYMWYINGEYKNTGETLLIENNLLPGVYRLDVTAFTSDHRRAGSAGHKFSVISAPITSNMTFIADHTVALESVLRSIPTAYIDAARNNLHVAYQHSSHGTHVSRGMFGLQFYKSGDEVLFGVTDSDPEPNKLDFNDYYFSGEPGCIASYGSPVVQDLTLGTRTGSPFVDATRGYLDNPANADINVVMWAWCSIANANINNYLTGMQTLIDEYGPGGTKPRAATTPVVFIFMTGHAEKNSNVGLGRPKDQAELIVDYCNENGYYCLDYYTIDTHTMDGVYYEDTGDDGDSDTYGIGESFYVDWEDAHTLGTDWFENKREYDYYPSYGSHNTQHITANRKAYAMWYILARIAGWDGQY